MTNETIINYVNSSGNIINWSNEINTSQFLTEELDPHLNNATTLQYVQANLETYYPNNETIIAGVNTTGLLINWLVNSFWLKVAVEPV